MDLLDTRMEGGGERAASEQPGTSMDHLQGLGRPAPSLISSLWSVQVQNEGSASDFQMMGGGCGSQNSLPEIMHSADAATAGGPNEGRQPFMDVHAEPFAHHNVAVPLRSVKSLSDLCCVQISQAMASIGYPQQQQEQQQEPMFTGNRRSTEVAFSNVLSKQQRDSQINDWLQEAMKAMRLQSEGGTSCGADSPALQPQLQQQSARSPFSRADTAEH